jgi:hypothetical protein
MKTLIEIIDETVEVYSDVSKRALQTIIVFREASVKCRYKAESGNLCAFSRALTEEGVELVLNYFEGDSASTIIRGNKNKFNASMFKEEYRAHADNSVFWDAIQALHDKEENWNIEQGGLSEIGKQYVETLKDQYK